MQQDLFLVSEARDAAFAKLPEELRRQLAFRHFYTDELDASAGAMSIKFLSLLIYYFCAMFRLEGRRRQYEERPSDTSGAEFAKAHQHAKSVFHALSSCYSVILLRYSVHSKISVKRKISEKLGKNGQVLGGGYGVGSKTLPTHRVVQEAAFHYASDEMVFFEVLYQISADTVSLAFDGDVGIQTMAVSETNRLFRSQSFLFYAQQRDADIKARIIDHDRKAKSVLENSQQLIELLTPLEPKLSMKHATHQRTPFLDSKLPGSSNVLKYLRVKRQGQPSEPSLAEKKYSVEMARCPFAAEHRAQQQQQQDPPLPKVSANDSNGSLMSNLRVTGSSPEFEHTTTQQRQSSTRSKSTNNNNSKVQQRSVSAVPSLNGTMNATTATAMAIGNNNTSATTASSGMPLLTAPAEEWLKADMASEIGKIYQALANGVVVSTFGVPPDLLLSYDVQGVLMLDSSSS